jgi:Cu/Ag efflux pump CusA
MRVLAMIAMAIACGERWPPRAHEPALTIDVIAPAPGFGSEQVERYVAIPLEHAFGGLPSLVDIRSTSEADQAIVVLGFDNDDAWAMRSEVIARLANVQLPPGIEAMLGRTSRERIAMRYVLHGDAVAARTFADWHIERALKTIVGVVDVDTRGGEVEEIHVMLDPARLAARGVTANDVMSAIGAAGVARLAADDNVRSVGLANDIGAIERLIVKRDVRVADVAIVSRGRAPRACAIADARADDVVEGIVRARADADLDELRVALESKLLELAKAAPAGIAIAPVDLDREVLVALPSRSAADQLAIVRPLAAAARELGGDFVVETCRPSSTPSELPDVATVRVAGARADAVAARLERVVGVRVVQAARAAWIRIAGDDREKLASLANTFADSAERIAGVAVVPRVGIATVEHVEVVPIRARLARYDANVDVVTRAVHAVLAGEQVARAYDGQRAIDIVVHAPGPLADVPIATPAGTSVPLREVAAISSRQEPRAIVRAYGREEVALRVGFANDDARDAVRDLVKAFAVPVGYTLRVEEAR